MKKVIIGIHGLGNKPPKYLLKKWWKDAMLEGLKKAGYDINLPVFELVYWADILYEKPLNFWQKNIKSPYFLDEPYLKAPENYKIIKHSIRKKINIVITGILNKIFLTKDKTLKNRFISDFILQKYFYELEIYYNESNEETSDFKQNAKNHIIQRLTNVILKYQNYDIMIVAHSMGTIIAFDVLSFLMSEIKINTLVTIGSPLGFPIVISKIVQENHKLKSDEKSLKTPGCITYKWYNHADIEDNVALNYNLSDVFEPNANSIKPTDVLVNNNYEVNGHSNPHKSFGYLRTPEFSAILKEFSEAQKYVVIDKLKNKVKDVVDNMRLHGEKIWNKNKSA